MRAPILRFFAITIFSGGFLVSLVARQTVAADTDQAVLQADHQFLQAAAKADAAALGKLLDPDFTWTDSDGKTLSLADVLHAMPKPTLGDEGGIGFAERTYGHVGAVSASRGKVHVLLAGLS